LHPNSRMHLIEGTGGRVRHGILQVASTRRCRRAHDSPEEGGKQRDSDIGKAPISALFETNWNLVNSQLLSWTLQR